MIDWERRKKSEKWVKEKSDEFIKSEADCSLTFAEWCYEQGKADGRAEALDDFANALLNGEQNEEFAYNIKTIAEQLKENNNGKRNS